MNNSFPKSSVVFAISLLSALPAWAGGPLNPQIKPQMMKVPTVTVTPANPYVGQNVTIKWHAPAKAPGAVLGCWLRVDHYGPGQGTPQGPGQVGTHNVVNQSVSPVGQYILSNVKPFKYRAGIRCTYKNGRPLASRIVPISVRPKPIKKPVGTPSTLRH